MFKLNVRPIRIGLWALMALVLSLTGCNLPGLGQQASPGGETPAAAPSPTVNVAELPPTAPQVVAQRPYPGEELPLDGSIDVYFDQPMNRASVESALSIEPVLDVNVMWVDDSTLRIVPAEGELSRAERYRLLISEEAEAANGLALEAPAEIEVQTVGFLQVGEVVPAPGATGVSAGSVITVFFNRPVVPLGIPGDGEDLPHPLTISPEVEGEGEWVNTSIYQWRPAEPLEGNQTYTVTVNAGLEDQTGGVLEEPFTWEFTTLPPDVIAVQPAEPMTPLDAPVVVEFNQPVDRNAAQQAFSLVDGSGQPVPGSFTWNEDGTEMTFQPSGLLALGTDYRATVSAEALPGFTRDAEWSFQTVPALAVVNTDPRPGESNANSFMGLTIYFSAPVDEDTLDEDLLVVEPALPAGATFFYSTFDHTWNISATLDPSTTYTVTLLPGVADPYGNTIDEPYTWTFTTAQLDPLVQFNTQGMFGLYDASRTTELFVIHRNTSRIDFQLASVPLEDFGRLTGPNSYEVFDSYEPAPENVLRTWSIATPGELNERTYVRVPVVSEAGGSLEPGIYLLSADAPETARFRHFMIVATANLTLKTSFDESLVWLTDLQDGQPVEGVDVRIYDSEFNQVSTARTDADGVAAIDDVSVDNLWDPQYAIAEGNGHFAVALSQWDEGIQPWQFGAIPTIFNREAYSLYLYTDRPIYRPGQEVYFKGVLRAKDDVTYSLPPQSSVDVIARNDQGDTILEDSLALNEFGTFNGQFVLDEEAGLGFYVIEVTIGDLTSVLGFQVAEYRAPEFTVTVEPETDQVLAGEEIEVTVDAEFFFGGPVSDAEVEWTVLSDAYFFQPRVPGNFSFVEPDPDEELSTDFIPGFGVTIADGTGRTDENGEFTFSIPASIEDSETSRRFTIEAVVTDINEQAVAGRAEVIVHKGEVYVGVEPEVYVAGAGQPFSATVLALDWDAEPVAGQEVTVELVEQRWFSVQEEDEFGRTQWTWNLEENVIGEPETVTTDADGKAEVTFTAPEGGSYRVRATVTDAQGNTQRGGTFVWVSGEDFVTWRQMNNDRIDLVADRASYQPGDIAEILIASPFQGNDVQALITVERGSILSHEVITLPSNSYVYELPLDGIHAPNVYVSVVIVKGVDDTNTTPAFKVGLVRLEVEPVEQTLELQVTPDRSTVGPGEEVTYTIRAADFEGNPVDAEVSLALVDLATLSLVQPNSGPIAEHFYGDAAIGVRTAVPLANLVDRLNQTLFDMGKGGGGGGGEAFFEIREEFRDTAYWEATVRTGEDGIAQVSITLPDNLTTWRMDARAVTADTLVGQQQVDLVATRPLLVRPNTPRFFVAGDEATVSAVVNNNTDEAIDASVRLDAAGVSVMGTEPVQQVSIPAGGRVEVAWDITIDPAAEWVDLTFSAEGGGLSDASKPPLGDPNRDRMLPVYRYDVPETVGTAGQLAEAGSRTEGIVLPPTYDVEQGRVLVRIDPSLAAASVDALDYLEQLPYESTEVTVSRFLPNALTLNALRELDIEDQELETKLRQEVRRGLQRLYAQQHVDGGWGWFVNNNSDPTVTAYVVQGLLAAQDAGYGIEQRVLDDALAYLRGSLRPLDRLSVQSARHTQAYILYVLAEAGVPDASRTVQLYEGRQGMQHWAQALIAQALWLIDPEDDRLDNLQSDLTNAAIVSATGAHWEEETDDIRNWNTDTRSTAIILATYARIWPESDLVPNIVRWLMIAREAGHWETTQETAWSLIGLTRWMAVSGELDASYRWSFEFNGQPMADGEVSRSNVREAQQISIDVADLLQDEVNRLTFERTAGDGRLYYSAHLTAYLPVEEVEPLSRGVIVSRRYLDENGNPVTGGTVGDVVTVELTIVAPNDLYYVVVEDPYPAGAEAVNLALETESILGERPTLQPENPLERGWGWWYFAETDLRDEKAVMFADVLPAGTYQYTYQLRLGLPGEYRVIPPTARQFYLPEVYGRGAGSVFTITGE
ncbi:MAG: Ig-like domain-containing protein [Aggregatilineales bacterium]|nr:Ig-like domain-containing protein [Aggregatilineales bacterium]HPV07185.1 Ig-like domain-containing protein [Aggregatilineales bacterium]